MGRKKMGNIKSDKCVVVEKQKFFLFVIFPRHKTMPINNTKLLLHPISQLPQSIYYINELHTKANEDNLKLY